MFRVRFLPAPARIISVFQPPRINNFWPFCLKNASPPRGGKGRLQSKSFLANLRLTGVSFSGSRLARGRQFRVAPNKLV